MIDLVISRDDVMYTKNKHDFMTVQMVGLVFVSWLQLVLFPTKKRREYERREREKLHFFSIARLVRNSLLCHIHRSVGPVRTTRRAQSEN